MWERWDTVAGGGVSIVAEDGASAAVCKHATL